MYQLSIERLCQISDSCTFLRARIIEDKCQRDTKMHMRHLPSQCTDNLRMNRGGIGHRNTLMRDGMDCPADVQATSSSRGVDQEAGKAPQISEKWGKHHVHSLNKTDGALTRFCFGYTWFALVFVTVVLWLSIGLCRDPSSCSPTPSSCAKPDTNVCCTTANPGERGNDIQSFLTTCGRFLTKVRCDGCDMITSCTVRLIKVPWLSLIHTTLAIRTDVTGDGMA